MKNLELQKCILGPVYTNCYLLKNKETGELIIVDPADCPEKIEMKISLMNGKPVAILLTHGHFDHILAAQAVKEKYNIPIYACRQEEEMLREPSINMTHICYYIWAFFICKYVTYHKYYIHFLYIISKTLPLIYM